MVVPSDFLMDFLIENPLGNLVPRQKTGPRVGSTKLAKIAPPGIRTRVARLEGVPATTAPQVLSHPPVLLSPIRKSAPGALPRIWNRIWNRIKNRIKNRIWDIFGNPARPGPGEAAPPSAAEHAPTYPPTLPHTCTCRRG